MFTYRSLTAADAQGWREIFVTGVNNFPTGFLMTPAEVDDLTMERCQTILDAGGTRGIFQGELLAGFADIASFSPSEFVIVAKSAPSSSWKIFMARALPRHSWRELSKRQKEQGSSNSNFL